MTVPQRITNSIGTPEKRGDKAGIDIETGKSREEDNSLFPSPPNNDEQHN